MREHDRSVGHSTPSFLAACPKVRRSGRLTRSLATLGMTVAALVMTAAVAGAQDLNVKSGISLSRDTVRVGDPFTLTIAVLVPRDATVEFPADPDSTAAVAPLAPRALMDGVRGDAETIERQAVYRLAAWDINTQRVLSGNVVVRLGKAERRIPLAGTTVFVQSVLPSDSTVDGARDPKPARALLTDLFIPWWVWLLLALAALITWLLIRWWRRRGELALMPQIDPYDRAIREFDRVDALGLVDAGERGRHIALSVDVLRGYLADRFPGAPLSSTTSELLTATRGRATVLHERLLRALNEADLVKFARRPVTADRALDLAKESRAIVEHEHRMTQQAAVAAARAATKKAAA
jgi:hypothetical protein